MTPVFGCEFYHILMTVPTNYIPIEAASTRLYLPTPLTRVLLEKPHGFQPVKNFPHFMETEVSLPHSQVLTNFSYPQTARPSPLPHKSLTEEPSSYYPPIYAWVSQVISFPHVSPPKLCICLSPVVSMQVFVRKWRYI